jgi:hypothetical protein
MVSVHVTATCAEGGITWHLIGSFQHHQETVLLFNLKIQESWIRDKLYIGRSMCFNSRYWPSVNWILVDQLRQLFNIAISLTKWSTKTCGSSSVTRACDTSDIYGWVTFQYVDKCASHVLRFIYFAVCPPNKSPLTSDKCCNQPGTHPTGMTEPPLSHTVDRRCL